MCTTQIAWILHRVDRESIYAWLQEHVYIRGMQIASRFQSEVKLILAIIHNLSTTIVKILNFEGLRTTKSTFPHIIIIPIW